MDTFGPFAQKEWIVTGTHRKVVWCLWNDAWMVCKNRGAFRDSRFFGLVRKIVVPIGLGRILETSLDVWRETVAISSGSTRKTTKGKLYLLHVRDRHLLQVCTVLGVFLLFRMFVQGFLDQNRTISKNRVSMHRLQASRRPCPPRIQEKKSISRQWCRWFLKFSLYLFFQSPGVSFFTSRGEKMEFTENMVLKYDRLQDHCQRVLLEAVECTQDERTIELLSCALDTIEKVVLRSKVHTGQENLCDICKNVRIMSNICCKQNICWRCVHRVKNCPFCRRCIPSRTYRETGL